MSTEIWDRYWETSTVDDALRRVEEEQLSRRFAALTSSLLTRLGSLQGRRFVELGAGAGTTAIAFARRGGEITLVDNSAPALTAGERATAAAQVKADVVDADLFEPPAEHAERYDVAMSFGVAEHFVGDERTRILAAHLRWLRPGGVAVVSVPNSLCPTYRIWKWWLERTGRWQFGFEDPFRPGELRRLVEDVGGEDVQLVGSSAVGDLLRFATPMLAHRASGGRLRLPDLQTSSPLDPILGYALAAVFNRPS